MSAFPPDIEAEIRFLTAEEGGRKTPVRSGYRPQFRYDERDWDAHQEYPDVELVQPGDIVRTYLWFFSPDAHLGHINPGMEFEVCEGKRVVGRGCVTKILNLVDSAQRGKIAR